MNQNLDAKIKQLETLGLQALRNHWTKHLCMANY